MAVVVGNNIVVNGYVVGTLAESKYEVPTTFSVEYSKKAVYVIAGRSE